MKINLLNTAHGLVPMYDEDFNEKKKLAVGQVYVAEIRVPRNYQFLKKAFALMNTAWALLPERTQNGFRSFEVFRDSVTVAAGYVDVYYDITHNAWRQKPKSWAFDKMDEVEFSDLYERMKDVIWGILSVRANITQEVFERTLMNF